MTDQPCPHFTPLSETLLDLKRILFQSEFKTTCSVCKTNPSTYLNLSQEDHTEVCLACLNETKNDKNAIQVELETGEAYCFQCNDTPHKVSTEGFEIAVSIDKRRKAEQSLYLQELRREDMSLMYYLLEKQWSRTWMLFRTREGSPLPTKITNNRLARLNGTLDPTIKLPMDKYRPSPETHADLISEKLWFYLSKAYGVQGKAYNEDDITAPEYARLRVYVDDFKKSIHLYP